MTSELVRLSVERGVATITLDSPHNRNALSSALLSQLDSALTAVRQSDPRLLVLGHTGPVFCSGVDLKERAQQTTIDSTPLATAIRRLLDAPFPTIAAVAGPVRAGGVGLMASCDLVVVSSQVTFALTEVRIGVAPAIISVPLLRRIPAAWIAPAMLTGEPFDAAEARRIGLVTHVTDDVAGTTADLCEAILAASPRAIAHTKRVLDRVPGLPLDQALDETRALSDELFMSADAAEGMAAFRDKRAPVWPA